MQTKRVGVIGVERQAAIPAPAVWVADGHDTAPCFAAGSGRCGSEPTEQAA